MSKKIECCRCDESCPIHHAPVAINAEMLEALKGIAEDAQERINDYGADIQEGGNPKSSELSKWCAVLAAIAKAEGGA